jgi:hypothetical protein
MILEQKPGKIAINPDRFDQTDYFIENGSG